jgi:hypothetical protein
MVVILVLSKQELHENFDLYYLELKNIESYKEKVHEILSNKLYSTVETFPAC